MRRASKRATIQKRRADLATLLQAGLSYREAAETLKVSLGTVAKDAGALFEEWREDQRTRIEVAMALDLRRLDIALRSIYPDVKSGDLRAIDRLLGILERRARIFGYDAPAKAAVAVAGHVQLTDRPIEELTDEQLEQIIIALTPPELLASVMGDKESDNLTND